MTMAPKVVEQGKNAAIRRIMRDRAAAKQLSSLTQSPYILGKRNSNNDNDNNNTNNNNNDKNNNDGDNSSDGMGSLLNNYDSNHQNNYSSDVSRVVTFDDNDEDENEVILARRIASTGSAIPPRPSIDSTDDEEQQDSTDDDDDDDGEEEEEDSSLTSSHWALMQYDVMGDIDRTTSKNKNDIDYCGLMFWNPEIAESLALQLLDTSLTTLTPTYTDSKSSRKVTARERTGKSVFHISNKDRKPNESWSSTEEEDELSNNEIPHPEQNDVARHANQIPSDLSLPKGHDDTDDAPKNYHRSAFTTFRCNSTSIALDETDVYIRKIHRLEKQLAETQEQLIEERAQRNFESKQSDGNENIPPVSTNLRTPASIRPNTISRRRSFSAADTPQTLSSTMSSKITTENIWERNKTLVTEIRFADQTCVELAHQKAALQEQFDALHTRYQQIEHTNHSLRSENETLKANAIAAETEIALLREQLTKQQYSPVESNKTSLLVTEDLVKSIKQENKDLLQKVQDSREQMAALRDEMIEHLESYQDDTSELKDQILHLVSKWNPTTPPDNRHHSDQSSPQQLRQQIQFHQVIQENEALRHEISERDALASDAQKRTQQIIRRAMETMHIQYETLQSTMSRKVGAFDHRLDTLRSTIQYLEDAILSCDDESDDMSSTEENSMAHDMDANGDRIHPIIESATMESDRAEYDSCVNATFTSGDDVPRQRRNNETMDLAMMEEARADLALHSVDDMHSSETNNVDTPISQRYHFDGMSRLLSEFDVASPSSDPSAPTIDYENGNYNFLQHVQWLATSNVTRQPSSQDKIEHGDFVTSRFHCGLKHVQSNLSYSESENSSIQHERTYEVKHDCLALVPFKTLRHNANDLATSVLDDSFENISKRNEVGMLHEHSMLIQDESLVMDKFVAETEVVEVAGNLTIGSSVPDIEMTQRNIDLLQEDKNRLIEQLTLKSQELQNASELVNILKDEAVKREKLMKRFESLRSEKDEADKRLRAKCIVPRGVSDGETSKLVEKLHGEIDMFREELRKSTQTVESLTNKFEIVEAEKKEQIETLHLSLKATVEDREALHQEIATLRCMNEVLLTKKESLKQFITNQNHKIEKLVDTIDCCECQLEVAKNESNELRDELKHNEKSNIEIMGQLDKIQVERNSLMVQIKGMTEIQMQLENEKQRIELKLVDTERALANADQMVAAAETQASNLAKELKGVVSELKIAREAKEAYSESFRQSAEFRTAMNYQLEVQANQLLIYHDRIESLENELHIANNSLKNSSVEIRELHQTNDNLVTKCSKLRDYIRKVTRKCHEWEIYHDRESTAVKQLYRAYDQSCRKASTLSMICHEKDQRVAILQEAQRDLEAEIEEIARELASISQYEFDESVQFEQ